MDLSLIQTIGSIVILWMSGLVVGMAWMGTVMSNQRLEEGACPCKKYSLNRGGENEQT
jgi:hypothetical protein